MRSARCWSARRPRDRCARRATAVSSTSCPDLAATARARPRRTTRRRSRRRRASPAAWPSRSGPHGVTVNAISPGTVATPLWDGLDEDAARRGPLRRRGAGGAGGRPGIATGPPAHDRRGRRPRALPRPAVLRRHYRRGRVAVSMRIRRLTCTRVLMPLEAPTRWALGVHADVPRLLVHLETEEGVDGVGETLPRAGGGGPAGAAPRRRWRVSTHSRSESCRHGWRRSAVATTRCCRSACVAAIETACLDAAGRAHGVSVSTLLGGALRRPRRGRRVPLLPRAQRRRPARRRGDARGARGAGRGAGRALRLPRAEAEGRRARGRRGAARRCGCCASASATCRCAGIERRVEPRDRACGARSGCAPRGWCWSTSRTPSADMAGMARAAARVGVPLATNMSVVAPEHLAPAVHLGAVDVVLGRSALLGRVHAPTGG